ncbi:speedy protein 1-A-like [Engystomops pustulosus]|uniref:speedy protein 1-A-like n=1 Tax=Engystomops pustulosus TaxID=76066 RepID=UPI003AFA87AD
MRKRKRELIDLYNQESAQPDSPEETKKKKMDTGMPLPEERTAFFTLLEDELIRRFLDRDSCLRMSDKYLLATVLEYFRRTKLRTEEYGTYFFPSLFLGCQLEEDLDFHREMFLWVPGSTWTIKKDHLLRRRDELLRRMGFRAWVGKETCDLIMAQDPDHWAWKRNRKDHHSRAVRWFRRDPQEFSIRGPWITPPPCSLCATTLHPSKEEEPEDPRKEESPG